MRRLTLVSGPAWPLGTRVRAWIEREAKYVPVDFLLPGSALAERRLSPTTRRTQTGPTGASCDDELVALADDGRLWRGDKAWVVLLWALRRWRSSSLRLAAPSRRNSARRFVTRVVAGREADGDSVASLFGRGLLAVATLAAIATWAAAALLTGPVGLLLALFAIGLFVLGRSGGLVASTLVLGAAVFAIDRFDGAPPHALDTGAYAFLAAIGVPALLLFARVFRPGRALQEEKPRGSGPPSA